MPATQNVLVELEFTSPVIFQRSWHERPWRISSDCIVRALMCSYTLLYASPKEFIDILERDLIRFSSLLILHENNLYIPIYGVRGYRTLNGDIIDPANIMRTISKVRMSRIEGIEPTPYEEYILEMPKYRWGLIISSVNSQIMEKILSAFRLLGDLGIGAKKTKGAGRFSLLSNRTLKDYNVNVYWSGLGILISRYRPTESKILPTKIRTLYQERIQVFYSSKCRYESIIIAEGSELEVRDSGEVDIIKNDLGYDVPLYFRPLLLK